MMGDGKVDWLCYAMTGREFAAMDALTADGIEHWRGTRVQFERRGKSRTPDAFDYPALPNYVWVRPTLREQHLVIANKHLARSVLFMTHADVAEFSAFRKAVDAREAEARRIAGNRAAIRIYAEGETIHIKDGPFAGKLATFANMVRGASDLFPKIAADMDLMGRQTRVLLDPLWVAKAAE